MLYVFAIIGIVLGFAAGLAVVNMFLRGYSTKELTKTKSLRWTYGLAVWIFAALGGWGGVWLYNRSFF